jgi:hypothetical protein
MRYGWPVEVLQLLSLAGFPLLLAGGGLAAWRISRRERERLDAPDQRWRDTSLDDWRRERDEAAEVEREVRRTTPQATGLLTRDETETTRQQRIGG